VCRRRGNTAWACSRSPRLAAAGGAGRPVAPGRGDGRGARKTMDRRQWRLVTKRARGEDDSFALRQVTWASATRPYVFERRWDGRRVGPMIRSARASRWAPPSWARRTRCQGHPSASPPERRGIGGLLFRAHEWRRATRPSRATKLFARTSCRASRARSTRSGAPTTGRAPTARASSAPRRGVRRAFIMPGREVAQGFEARTAAPATCRRDDTSPSRESTEPASAVSLPRRWQ